MTDQELQYDIYQPFGPSILKVNMPRGYVNLLNAQAEMRKEDSFRGRNKTKK